MNIDIGLPPTAILLLALLVLAIVSDFLLDLFSVRMSQSTGRVQSWLFNHFGQNLVFDLFIATVTQFFSFRKKAFFMQFSSLVNVGSFNRKQILMVFLGTFFGFGLCSLLLLGGVLWAAAAFAFASVVCGVLWGDRWRDLGVAFLSLSLFLTILFLFNQYLADSQLNIHNYRLGETFVIALVLASLVLFRTPVAYFLTLAILHLFVGFNLLWFPIFFLIFGTMTMAEFYGQLLLRRQRLYFSIVTGFLLQISQFAIAIGFVFLFRDRLLPLVQASSFLGSYVIVIVSFAIYMVVPTALLSLVLLLFCSTPVLNRAVEKKGGSQKIINNDRRGQSYSIHLSLFLLRQEFKKFTTSVHTIFKISRESDHASEAINQKFVRYQGMLVRVGDELKELCFSIGKQRSYRWHVKEIMSYYRIVNQLELLVEDLAAVAATLRKENLDEEWEKECRYWLGLQLKLFESFFHHTLGVGKDDPAKVQGNIQKSYEVLDRLNQGPKESLPVGVPSQTFYRITESIGGLAL